jgi:hypothetical protein
MIDPVTSGIFLEGVIAFVGMAFYMQVRYQRTKTRKCEISDAKFRHCEIRAREVNEVATVVL